MTVNRSLFKIAAIVLFVVAAVLLFFFPEVRNSIDLGLIAVGLAAWAVA